MSRRLKWGLGAALLGVGALACGYLVHWVTTPPLRRALPSSARDVREEAWQEPGPIGQDHSYCLRADLPAADFSEYIHRVELAPEPPLPTAEEERLIAMAGCAADWWQEPERAGDRFVRLERGCWTSAHHRGGQLYVTAGCL